MQYKSKSILFIALAVCASFGAACQQPQTKYSNVSVTSSASNVKASSPTEAYKMLYAAVKAKDKATIKGLMSKGSLGLAEMSAGQQKKSVDQILENGLVAPTLADSLSEMRDERIKDNIGAVEVFNPKDNRWEDLPFVLEDGGWKLAVGDLFANTFDPNGTLPKGTAQKDNEASNKQMPMPSNVTKFPEINSNSVRKAPPMPNEPKSVEVPKEKKP